MDLPTDNIQDILEYLTVNEIRNFFSSDVSLIKLANKSRILKYMSDS